MPDGVGVSSKFMWWQHDSPFIKCGNKARVVLTIHPKEGESQYLTHIRWPEELTGDKPLLIWTSTMSGSISIDSTSAFKLGTIYLPTRTFVIQSLENNGGQDENSIVFEIQAPIVTMPTLTFLSLSYSKQNGDGGSFSLPYIIIP